MSYNYINIVVHGRRIKIIFLSRSVLVWIIDFSWPWKINFPQSLCYHYIEINIIIKVSQKQFLDYRLQSFNRVKNNN